jgi:putative DNA primase/helicase
MAYCCYREYPIQVLFCFCGIGRNGKTQFLKLLTKFLGEYNCCNTDLDLIAGQNRSRFETFKLYRKLAGLMGETDFGILSSSSLLKRLVGGDLIGFEMKGKNPFDAYSYCKLLIASNSLPSSEDTSEGFYRRWIILDFVNQFPEGTDIINTIPNIEYCNLARKVKRILPEILKKGSFTGQGDTEYRKMKYVLASNPLPMFIKKYCIEEPNLWIRYSELYSSYCVFLNSQKKRVVAKKEFSKALTTEGFECRKTSKNGEIDYYVEGIGWFGGKFSLISLITLNSQSETIMGKREWESQENREIKENYLIRYIENNDFADNQDKCIEIFGEDLVSHAIINGKIFTYKGGWLKNTK